MIGYPYDERVTEHKAYPWAGQSLRSANKKYYGQFLANFKRTRGDAMGVAGNLNDGWDYTCPVKWYFPNDYGLYNMAGNVSEWCMDVFRKTVGQMRADDLDPYRGNVYLTPRLDEDNAVFVNEETGKIEYIEVAPDNNRRNYRQANNVNYLDGDRASLLENWKDSEEAAADEEAEEEGDSEFADEEEGEEVGDAPLTGEDGWTNNMYRRQTDSQKDNPTSSLVNNKVRVVKGGSWRDRAYYLQSSTRRYFDQDKSTSWIGFRCAMDRLGSRTK
jgi:gliding motility-associated lipoprotein GldJ